MTGEEKVVFYGGVLVAIILHEISHGVVAFFFGDDTAKRSGRLTLNPPCSSSPVAGPSAGRSRCPSIRRSCTTPVVR